jgi:hypothetical protein
VMFGSTRPAAGNGPAPSSPDEAAVRLGPSATPADTSALVAVPPAAAKPQPSDRGAVRADEPNCLLPATTTSR